MAADSRKFESLKWRNIGPHRGGRVTCVVGDPTNPAVFYMGSCGGGVFKTDRSEEHTSELQSREHIVCRLLLEKKNPAVRCRGGASRGPAREKRLGSGPRGLSLTFLPYAF